MNSDKAIILLASFMLLFGLIFHETVYEEWSLLFEHETELLQEDLNAILYTPHLTTEREVKLKAIITGLEKIQEKIENSYVVRYLMDYRENIAQLKADLEHYSLEMILFTTADEHVIAAASNCDKEMLLRLGKHLDHLLSGQEPELAVLSICFDNQNPLMQLQLEGVSHIDYQPFVNSVSKDLFNKTPATLLVEDAIYSSNVTP